MKRLILAIAIMAAASGQLFAGEARTKQAGHSASGQSQAKPVDAAKHPLLDSTKTFSIRLQADAMKAPAQPRSGIEVNPWIVPTFH